MPTTRFRELIELAAEQHGLVNTGDAGQVGYAKGTLDTMARRGQLERVATGLYRIPLLPSDELTTYMAAAMWPRGAKAVLSHETALDLWDVCDINPSKIHLIVPRRHRPQRKAPKGYVVHREDLDPGDVTTIEGVPAVTLDKAIRQCADLHVGLDLLEQAARHGREQGLLKRAEASALTEELELDRVEAVRP